MPPPQQYPCPVVVTPQVCENPVLMLVKVRFPATGAGDSWVKVDPVPSWPPTPHPQQYPCPVVATPQVTRYAVLMVLNVRSPATAVGVSLPTPAPVPS